MNGSEEEEFIYIYALNDELDRLINSPRFSHNKIAIEALEAVKWWIMEESVPVIEKLKSNT